ncbi:MAG TPA: hypothetical protein VJ233_05640 [Hyphomicrobiaceae bacterium]|nr:hypothetical protein [Hyphomicrobiaceae bacterium]
MIDPTTGLELSRVRRNPRNDPGEVRSALSLSARLPMIRLRRSLQLPGSAWGGADADGQALSPVPATLIPSVFA